MPSWIKQINTFIGKTIASLKQRLNPDLIRNQSRKLTIPLIILLVATGFYFAVRDTPILVDIGEINSGPMTVTIREEGETRVRDIYMVSSPIAGHLSRTKLDEGEMVKANTTIIASIHPLDPPFLDERAMKQLRARADAARAAVGLAEVEHQRAKISLQLSESEYRRALQLSKRKVISDSQMEKVLNEMQLKKAQVQSAKTAINLRKAELDSAVARLRQPTNEGENHLGKTCCINLLSPIDGVVLKVHARSRQAVSMGTHIAEVGDPANLEIIVDLLSSDAPKIAPGSTVIITDWGDSEILKAIVNRIEPAAFTKVSSLGIEEQRVNAVLDLKSVPKNLGAGYRVLADFIIWQNENVLQIPIAALFRSKGKWSTFVVKDGHAILKSITIGQMNNQYAEVKSGIKTGEKVILYPNDQLENGSVVEKR